MTSSPSQNLLEHLKTEHQQSPVSVYLREIVYGGIDGIVTTFAVVAGFGGAQAFGAVSINIPVLSVLLFGLANLFADGLSMGLGDFLSLRAERDVFRKHEKKEQYEIENNPEDEAEETVELLQTKGFTLEESQALVTLYRKNPSYWLDWMMHHELEMEKPSPQSPAWNALVTFVSFLVFGAIPLSPFFFSQIDSAFALKMSLGLTFFALFILALLKWSVTRISFLRSVLETLILGGLAAGVAFGVGVWFGG